MHTGQCLRQPSERLGQRLLAEESRCGYVPDPRPTACSVIGRRRVLEGHRHSSSTVGVDPEELT